MIHAGGGDAWADESTFHPMSGDSVAAAAIAAVREMEETIRESGLDWLMLRGGFFYGPGTAYEDAWFDIARAGKLRLPADGSDFVSLIHIADMAAATAAAIDRWPSRQSLIVADDVPATWLDILSYVSALVGSDPPRPGAPATMPSFRVTNRRAREVLSWAPFYSSYRAGLIR